MRSQQGAEWPDWRGETVVIVATGPTAADAPLIDAKGRARLIVIKSSWELAPWADVLYGCDRGWWIGRRGVPDFAGIKVSASPTVNKVYRDVRLVRLVAQARILTEEKGTIGCGLRTGGGHSGFHAMNLAVQFGARRIVLIGMDMRVDLGFHWHRHSPDMKWRASAKQMEESRAALDGCASQFAALGVDVVNASLVSALRNYRKADLLEALACR